MADYICRVETTRRKVYTLRMPTNWSEVSKVFAAIHQDEPKSRTQWDDFVTVEADDEHIRIWHAVEDAIS